MSSHCMAVLWALVLVVAPFVLSDVSLNYTDLAECPFQVEPIGCYQDRPGYKKRALPQQILNSRDIYSDVFHAPSIDWGNYQKWLSNFICECAKKLFKSKKVKTDYIGLQFYGECWANLEQHQTQYSKYSKSNECIEATYKPYEKTSKCGLYMGQRITNYVYKVSKYSASPCFEMEGEYNSPSYGDISINVDGIFIKGKVNGKDLKGEISKGCKGVLNLPEGKYTFDYSIDACELKLSDGLSFAKKNCEKNDVPCPKYKSRGCWRDPFPRKEPSMRPLHRYAMNERDPYADNWNGRFVDWKNWGNGYLAGLLCRCAKVAHKTNMKYFGIQFYGECWTGNQDDFNKHGRVTTCVDDRWDTCPLETDNQCLSPICAGQWETNKVYELVNETVNEIP